MIIGFMLVLLLTIAVATDASAAYLRRTGLDTVADGAALAAAEALDEPLAYEQGIGADAAHGPALDPASAASQVEAYLRATGAYARFPGLRVGSRVEGDQVFVSVSAPLDLPLRIPGSPDRVSIRSTGSAVLQPAS